MAKDYDYPYTPRPFSPDLGALKRDPKTEGNHSADRKNGSNRPSPTQGDNPTYTLDASDPKFPE